MQFSELITKPVEFYLSIVAAAIYVWESNTERPVVSRFLITISSALLGLSLAPTLSDYVGFPEIISAVLVTAVGFLVLEIAAALIKDREYVKEIIKRRLGGPNG